MGWGSVIIYYCNNNTVVWAGERTDSWISFWSKESSLCVLFSWMAVNVSSSCLCVDTELPHLGQEGERAQEKSFRTDQGLERRPSTFNSQTSWMFQAPTTIWSFCQVLGGLLELKKNLGPKIEKQFPKTSDTISAAWHKFKTRLDKSVETMQLVEGVNYVPFTNNFLGDLFEVCMWRPISADICSDLPCSYLLSEATRRWICWKKSSRCG